MDTKIKILEELSLSNVLDKEAELIPLMTEEDEERLNAEEMPNTLAILPLRNTVLFPGVVIPITVGRDKSIKLIKEANNGNKIIGVVAQKDAQVEDPQVDDLNVTGTVAKILRVFACLMEIRQSLYKVKNDLIYRNLLKKNLILRQLYLHFMRPNHLKVIKNLLLW